MNIFINIDNNLYKIDRNSIKKISDNTKIWYFNRLLINKNNILFNFHYFLNNPNFLNNSNTLYEQFYIKKRNGIVQSITVLDEFLKRNDLQINYLLKKICLKLQIFKNGGENLNLSFSKEIAINISTNSYCIDFSEINKKIKDNFFNFSESIDYTCFLYLPVGYKKFYNIKILVQLDLSNIINDEDLSNYYLDLHKNEKLFKNLFLNNH